VVPPFNPASLIGLPALIAIILAVLAIAGYAIYRKGFKPR
jgi:hypothetical protein